VVRKTSNAKAANYSHEKSNPNWAGFIRCDMDNSDRERFQIWAEDNPSTEVLTMALDEAQEKALKLSFAFNQTEGTWMCSFTGTGDSPTELGKWTLTGWGGVSEVALQSLWFKHTEMLNKNWVKGYAVQGKKDRNYVG